MNLFKQCVAEFIGTFALIFIGIGAIHNNSPGVGVGLLGVALTHGLTIAVMVSATGGISGGHLNPAVTLGLLVGGKITLVKSIAYWLAQLSGAVAASFLLVSSFAQNGVAIVAGGTPDLAPNISTHVGIAIEIVLTFFLVFVVYGSAVDVRAPKIGGLAIGLTVALDILFGRAAYRREHEPRTLFWPGTCKRTLEPSFCLLGWPYVRRGPGRLDLWPLPH